MTPRSLKAKLMKDFGGSFGGVRVSHEGNKESLGIAHVELQHLPQSLRETRGEVPLTGEGHSSVRTPRPTSSAEALLPAPSPSPCINTTPKGTPSRSETPDSHSFYSPRRSSPRKKIMKPRRIDFTDTKKSTKLMIDRYNAMGLSDEEIFKRFNDRFDENIFSKMNEDLPSSTPAPPLAIRRCGDTLYVTFVKNTSTYRIGSIAPSNQHPPRSAYVSFALA